jgi:hypothetical protein
VVNPWVWHRHCGWQSTDTTATLSDF